MSGSEGDSLVVEVQKRVVTRPPLLLPSSPKLEGAGDPKVARVEADDLVTGMEDAAIARPRTAEWDSRDVTHRRHTISRRTHVPLLIPMHGANGRAHRRDHPAPRGARYSAGAAAYAVIVL